MHLAHKAVLLGAFLASVALSVPSSEQHVLFPSALWQDHVPQTSSSSLLSKLVAPFVDRIWSGSDGQKQRAQELHLGITNGYTKYGDDIVLRFKLLNERDAQAFADAIDTLYLDVWETNNDWVDIRLSRKVVDVFLDLLPEHMQLSYAPVITDVAQAIRNTYPTSSYTSRSHRSTAGLSPPQDLFFEDYQALSTLYPYLRQLASMFQDRARLFSIGSSYEGRDIPAFEIGLPHDEEQEELANTKRTIVILAGLHAREWISTSTAMYLLRNLLHVPGHTNNLVEKLLRHYDFVFLPVMNPDGYDYTWTTDRLWRKNRQSTSLSFCRGIDLDRSFPIGWDGDSNVENPCSESYAGEQPLEAVEAERLVAWIKNETDAGRLFEAFIDLHSYSERILYPYSYTCDKPPRNLEDLEEIAFGLAKAFRIASGHFYSVDSACEGTMSVLTPSSIKDELPVRTKVEESGGSALDYFYQQVEVKYAYQIKLRDTGTYGFLLPKENIVPTGRESFSALLAFGKWLLGNRGIEGYSDLSAADVWGEELPVRAAKADDLQDNDQNDLPDDDENTVWSRRRLR